MEVHLPDGGHLLVAGRVDDVLEALVHASGNEADLEAAIRDEAEAQGLSCSTSGAGRATILVVGRP